MHIADNVFHCFARAEPDTSRLKALCPIALWAVWHTPPGIESGAGFRAETPPVSIELLEVEPEHNIQVVIAAKLPQERGVALTRKNIRAHC